jgi:hypothetical protein
LAVWLLQYWLLLWQHRWVFRSLEWCLLFLCYTPCLEFVKTYRFHWLSELINMRDWREANFIFWTLKYAKFLYIKVYIIQHSQVNIKTAHSMDDWLHGRWEIMGSWYEYRFSLMCAAYLTHLTLLIFRIFFQPSVCSYLIGSDMFLPCIFFYTWICISFMMKTCILFNTKL